MLIPAATLLTAMCLLILPSFAQGTSAASGAELVSAQTNLEQLTQKDPRNARAWMTLAQTYAREKKTQAARSAAVQAEAAGADDPVVLHGLAFLFTDLIPDPKRAAPLEEKYAEKTPGDKSAWRRVAALYLDAGQPDRALAAGLRGLDRDPSFEMHTTLGQAYLGLHQPESAAAQFAEALRMDRYDEQAHFQLAQVYLQQGDFSHAEDVLLAARKIFDKSPQIELALGVCYFGERKFSQAIDQFLKTTKLDPDVPQPYLFLGRILDQTGERLPEATSRFALFNQRNPKNPSGYVLFAKALIAAFPSAGPAPELDHANALLEKAIALKPDDAEAHSLYGSLFERQLEFPRAAAELEKSIALNPREPAPHFHLSRVYERLGRKEDAARERELHQKLTEAQEARVPGEAKK
jgi:tetratricopeptide (TPR) repeat protein